ncbi:MAG: rod shape-determining protein MreC [Bacillota bacterium]
MGRRRIGNKGVALIIVLLLALLSAHFTGWNRTARSRVELLLRDALTPLESGVNIVLSGGESLFHVFLHGRELEEENRKLRQELEAWMEKCNLLEEYRQENIRLRQLVGFQEELADAYTMLPARVIARNPSNWYRTLTINRGRLHGVQPDMAVITPRGIVGRVTAAAERSSEVLLVLDPEGAVAGMVQNSRYPGIVEGSVSDQGYLQMIHLPYDSPVRENQTVITSGLGGIFPKGLRIGFITEIIVEPNGLMKKALIQPFVDFDRLEEVLVVIGEKGGS